MLLEAGSADIREMLNTSDISEDSKSASRGWRKDFQILSSQTRTSTILTILLYIYLPSYPLQDFSSRQHTAILQTSVQSVTHVQAPIPPGSALATDWRPQQNPPVWSFFPSRTNRSPSFLGNRETRRTCTWPTRSLHVPTVRRVRRRMVCHSASVPPKRFGRTGTRRFGTWDPHVPPKRFGPTPKMGRCSIHWSDPSSSVRSIHPWPRSDPPGAGGRL